MFLIVVDVLVISTGRIFPLEWERLHALVMLNLIFNSQFRVLIMRERRHFWSSSPSLGLVLLSLGTIIGFMFLGIYRKFVPAFHFYLVFTVMGFSVVFTLSIDIPKCYFFREVRLVAE